MTDYFKLVPVSFPAPPPRGKIMIATACVWICSICGETISGMGGPGCGEICAKCGDDILAGRLRYERTKEISK